MTWLKAAGLRAIRTVAQTALATIGTTALLHEVDWAVIGSASALGGLLSLLTSISGLPEVETDATPPPADYSPRHLVD